MAGIWSTLKCSWLIAEVTACDASTPPTESQLRKIASHSVQSDQNVTVLCENVLDELKDWQKDPASAFKSLQIIDYCMHEGSCEIIEWFQPHIQLFESFGAKEPSDASRLKLYSLEVANLLRNEPTLQAERVNSTRWKSRMNRTITSSWQTTGSDNNRENGYVEPPPPYKPGKGDKSSVGVTEKSVDEGEMDD